MRKIIILLIYTFSALYLQAQEEKPFSGYLYNEEYQVYMQLNLYDSSVKVPNQDIYGELPGYFGAKRDTRLWLVTEAEIVSKKKATLSATNDFGSEDFVGELIYDGDGNYTFKHKEGSTWKIVVNNKYVKIPKMIKLTRVD